MFTKITHPGRLATAIVVAAFALLESPTAQPAVADPAYSATELTFHNGDTALHGRVLVPTEQAAHRPAVVIVAGSGAREMDDYLPEAEAFVAAGVVVLIYDKRTEGYSLTERSYRQLGDDALAGLESLRARADVDPDHVGLWGHSEGGWVVPLAASRSDHVAFVMMAGASALAPARAQTWSTCRYLIHTGFSERACDSLAGNLTRVMVAAGMFPEADYDPIPALKRLDIPVLGIFAEYDQSTAPAESRDLMESALQANADPHSALRVIGNTSHNFLSSADGFDTDGEIDSSYLDLLGAWVVGLDGEPIGVTADRLPEQESESSPLQDLAWFESLALQGVALAILLLGFAAYPLSSLVGRLRKWPVNRGIAVASRVLVTFGAANVLGTLGFLGYLISTGAAKSLGPLALERPLAWLGLQLLAVATIGATVGLGVVSRRAWSTLRPGQKVRAGALFTIGVVFTPWALYWGLLTP